MSLMRLKKARQTSLERREEAIVISATPYEDPRVSIAKEQSTDSSLLNTGINPEISAAIIKAEYSRGLSIMTVQNLRIR